MSLNPLRWIEWLITEHGSSTVLRERLGLAKDQLRTLERENALLKSELDESRPRLEKAQIEINRQKNVVVGLHKEMAAENAKHDQEMRRLTKLYSEGKGLIIPAGILGQQEQDQTHHDT
jgi:regulator of replication initiation timing